MKASLSQFAGQPILVVEAGGTNFRAGWLMVDGDGKLQIVYHAKYPSKDLRGVADGIQAFRRDLQAQPVSGYSSGPLHFCAAVAGPVEDGRSLLTNLGWEVSAESLAGVVGSQVERIAVVNDMTAIAHGVRQLPASDLLTLNEGVARPRGPVGVIAAGTGLGKVSLSYVAELGRHVAIPSEGGHVAWAPSGTHGAFGDLQEQLLAYLHQEFQHVSAELLLSGRGLGHIFDYLVSATRWYDSDRTDLHTHLASRVERGDDVGKQVSEMAATDPLARMAMRIFVDIYGAEARNQALSVMSSGGVYVAGGIAPKHRDVFVAEQRFMQAFLETGLPPGHHRMLEQMPVRMVLSDDVGLYGAAYCALFNG